MIEELIVSINRLNGRIGTINDLLNAIGDSSYSVEEVTALVRQTSRIDVVGQNGNDGDHYGVHKGDPS